MSITKHLLALALGACLTARFGAGVSAQESLIEVYQRALHERSGHSRGGSHLSRARLRSSRRREATLAAAARTSTASARSNDYRDIPSGSDLDGGITVGSRTSQRQTVGAGLGRLPDQPLRSRCSIGREYATLKQADKRVARAETDYRGGASRTSCSAWRQRYFDGARCRRQSSPRRSRSVTAISRQLEQAQRRFEVGLIAITDVQQSQAGYDDCRRGRDRGAETCSSTRLRALARDHRRDRAWTSRRRRTTCRCWRRTRKRRASGCESRSSRTLTLPVEPARRPTSRTMDIDDSKARLAAPDVEL